jgi:hypothetical protein
LHTRVAFDHMKLPGKWSIQVPPEDIFSSGVKKNCRRSGVPVDFRLQAGYGDSYFFIASFIEDPQSTREIRNAEPLRHARSAPEALATWVAMKSIRGGDRQS